MCIRAVSAAIPASCAGHLTCELPGAWEVRIVLLRRGLHFLFLAGIVRVVPGWKLRDRVCATKDLPSFGHFLTVRTQGTCQRHEFCLLPRGRSWSPDYSHPPGKDEPLVTLSESQLLYTVLGVAIILTAGRGMAEIARRLRQPEVLGELIGGFLLGPSVFGALLPGAYNTIFLDHASATIFSGLSWIGAILLLLAAGLEVDLRVLRMRARPGILAAAFAIVPSLLIGSFFAWKVIGRVPPAGIFLGIVLSVTGVSVASKILMEMGVLRRDYGQVILAAGIASEVAVWLFVSVASSLHSASPILAGLRSFGFALAFILLTMT